MMKQRSSDAGFTVAGVMAVVGLLGVAAAVGGAPGKKAPGGRGEDYAAQVAEELQRARTEAITTRVPRHAFIYSNRVEIRAAKPGRVRGTWTAPTISDPVLHSVRAKVGVNSFDVSTRRALPDFTLSPTSSKDIVFGTGGAGSLDSARSGAVQLYINNDTVKVGHADREFRVEVAADSGAVSLHDRW
jgi:Tfp pilus assembly protein FimT